jgi:hypothetical protein
MMVEIEPHIGVQGEVVLYIRQAGHKRRMTALNCLEKLK